MKPRPAPVEGQPPAPAEPDDGNAISTVRVVRTEDAYVAVEHPEGWTEAEVRAALAARMIDFGAKLQFWNAEQRTRIREVAVGENEPDDVSSEPFGLLPEDLGDGGEEDEPAAGGEG